jgi:hypothetical protein
VITHHPFNPKPLTISCRHRIIFFFIYLGFLLLINLMANVNATSSSNVTLVEKWGQGHPRGSKNKPKSTLAVVASSSTSAKHRLGRPLGSKNKKPFVVTTDHSDRLDVSVAFFLKGGKTVGESPTVIYYVSIIFDAPCLFYTNYFMFCLHIMAFLCIFWN